MFGNILGNKSNICERDWSKFDRENFVLNYFLVDWEDLLEIDEVNDDNSSKIYLDKIKMLLDTYAPHLLKELINTNWNLNLNLDNLRLTKINICKKQIIYKFH